MTKICYLDFADKQPPTFKSESRTAGSPLTMTRRDGRTQRPRHLVRTVGATGISTLEVQEAIRRSLITFVTFLTSS